MRIPTVSTTIFPLRNTPRTCSAPTNVKRGLRNADGSGVVAGLTRISDVHGYNVVDGRVVPDEGHLILRGYDIEDLIENAQKEDRFGYEEVAYLLITGELPTASELDDFNGRLGAYRHLSSEFVRQFPITTVSPSIMNALQRAVLLLYAFDSDPDSIRPSTRSTSPSRCCPVCPVLPPLPRRSAPPR